jgi:hypothetical protein
MNNLVGAERDVDLSEGCSGGSPELNTYYHLLIQALGSLLVSSVIS